MKKLFGVCGLVLMSLAVTIAQEAPLSGFDRGSYSGALVIGFPYGQYKNYLAAGTDPLGTVGVSLTYLANPFAKRKENSKIFIGGEAGYQENKQRDFINQYGGNFYVSHAQYWFNVVARYRPVLWSSFINPFVDVAVGPRIFNSRIMEKVNEEEIYKIDGTSAVTVNFSLGGGIGFRVSSKQKSAKYIDLGGYVVSSNPVKTMNRQSVFINQSAEVFFSNKTVNPNQFQIRVGFTGFL